MANFSPEAFFAEIFSPGRQCAEFRSNFPDAVGSFLDKETLCMYLFHYDLFLRQVVSWPAIFRVAVVSQGGICN